MPPRMAHIHSFSRSPKVKSVFPSIHQSVSHAPPRTNNRLGNHSSDPHPSHILGSIHRFGRSVRSQLSQTLGTDSSMWRIHPRWYAPPAVVNEFSRCRDILSVCFCAAEKTSFIVGRYPRQHRISVRESTKALDNLFVFQRVIHK